MTENKVSPLLKILLSDPDRRLTENEVAARLNKVGIALERARAKAASFADWETITQVVNYVLGFIKLFAKDNTDLMEEQKIASRAVYEMSQRTPLMLTLEEEKSIMLMVGYWGDILEAISLEDLSQIEVFIDHQCEAAKLKRQLERPKMSRRSHRKPKKKAR